MKPDIDKLLPHVKWFFIYAEAHTGEITMGLNFNDFNREKAWEVLHRHCQEHHFMLLDIFQYGESLPSLDDYYYHCQEVEGGFFYVEAGSKDGHSCVKGMEVDPDKLSPDRVTKVEVTIPRGRSTQGNN
jgi:hypothetical protein